VQQCMVHWLYWCDQCAPTRSTRHTQVWLYSVLSILDRVCLTRLLVFTLNRVHLSFNVKCLLCIDQAPSVMMMTLRSLASQQHVSLSKMQTCCNASRTAGYVNLVVVI